ncbi:3-oxoacyl-ACP synthase III family protein [Lentzea sp. NPDC051213]|uniref:3-oxoacyl-ACP synthase III family protein n=1 Tax=Lentzea sp. NPDC051213 TaxID=3364126 RepID=UPI0037A78656
MTAVGILGIGAHVPDEVVLNEQISQWTGASPEWVIERTGIETRRYARKGTLTSDLAQAAVEDLFGDDPALRERVDLIVLATSTPDQPQPATAAILQHKLGLTAVPSFDVNAVCSGFVYALATAEAMLTGSMGARTGVVVGADIYSSIMNRSDRKTVSLFGDGAGAVLLGPVPDGYGIRATRLATHGDYRELVEVVAGGTRERVTQAAVDARRDRFAMDGRGVREYALRAVPKVIDETLAAAGLSVGDIDRVIMHQGNPKLVASLAAEVGVPMDRVPLTAVEYGNTGAASIPITMHRAAAQRPFERGERVLLAAVGGGMTAGASVLIWH